METISELLKDEGDEQQGGTVADKDAPWSALLFVSLHKNVQKIR